MKNKKTASAKRGLNKNFDQTNFKHSYIACQFFCSFCWRELPNGSVYFKGIGACPRCFRLSHKFVESLRNHRREYKRRFEVSK